VDAGAGTEHLRLETLIPTSMSLHDLTVVVPARDEEANLPALVRWLRGAVPGATILVVDSFSGDQTADVARNAGAEVTQAAVPGLGAAVKAGIWHADTRYVAKVDADVRPPRDNIVRALYAALLDTGRQFVHAHFESPYDEFPLTELCVRPILQHRSPAFAACPRPLSGQYVFNRYKVPRDLSHYPDDWSFDLALTLGFAATYGGIGSVDVGSLEDSPRPMSHYRPMATQIARLLLVDLGHFSDIEARDIVCRDGALNDCIERLIF